MQINLLSKPVFHRYSLAEHSIICVIPKAHLKYHLLALYIVSSLVETMHARLKECYNFNVLYKRLFIDFK